MLFKLKNVEYKITGKIVLNKINLSVLRGEHLLIHGPSGCGKTTLLNLMFGLLKPNSGQIFYENTDFSSLSEDQKDKLRAKEFGFVFQKLHLIKYLNVEQNINLAKNQNHNQNINRLIENLGLINKKKQLAKDLSFGEAQRVAIARGVINNPKVIFADEPTSSLDDTNVDKVMEQILMQTKKSNSTLIISSHDQRIKKLFKKTFRIKNERS